MISKLSEKFSATDGTFVAARSNGEVLAMFRVLEEYDITTMEVAPGTLERIVTELGKEAQQSPTAGKVVSMFSASKDAALAFIKIPGSTGDVEDASHYKITCLGPGHPFFGWLVSPLACYVAECDWPKIDTSCGDGVQLRDAEIDLLPIGRAQQITAKIDPAVLKKVLPMEADKGAQQVLQTFFRSQNGAIIFTKTAHGGGATTRRYAAYFESCPSRLLPADEEDPAEAAVQEMWAAIPQAPR